MFSFFVTRDWFSHMSCFSLEITESGSECTTAHQTSARAGDILAVVVLYNKPFKDVPCAARLMQWLAAPPATTSTRLNLAHCLVYDNSPVAQFLDSNDQKRIDLFHDESNGGTRAAYLHALKIAIAKGCSWILFLDHDTDLPLDFFQDAERALAMTTHDKPICAVVPHVFDGLANISPSWITSYGRVYAQKNQQTDGRNRVGLTAIASASIVQAKSLAAVLPIPAAFSLDYLDHWLFSEMQSHGGSIVISSARVEHSLSVQSMKLISIDRYKFILAAELEFLRGGSRYSQIRHFFWHVGRTLKLILSTRRPALARVCARAALNIICTK